MERIEISYQFNDHDDGEEKMVCASKRSEDSLRDTEICEMFLDFMKSVGFSEENITKYFAE